MDVSREEKKRFKALEKRLGYAFRRRVHLKRALLHRSYANEQRLPATEHNERYEFLGDTVLSLAVSHLLMQHFPQDPEGKLSKIRAAVVNEAQLAELARSIDLGDYLYVGKGEEHTGGRDKPSLLADCFEALLGAIYVDRGFAKAFEVVKRHYEAILTCAKSGKVLCDYKTRLQEEAQSRFKVIPRYRLVRECGPDHHKTFEIQLTIRDDLYGAGSGTSKKAAEQEAAREALVKMGCL